MFDSEEMPPGDRLDAWHDFVTRALIPNQMSIEAASFRASVRAVELGSLQMSALSYPSLYVQRTDRMIRQFDPEMYSVALIQRGRQLVTQAGRQAMPPTGNLVFYSTSRPYEAQVLAGPDTASILMAQVPRALLPFPRDMVDHLLATPLSGRDGYGALLRNFLTHLAADPAPYRPPDGPRLGMILLDLLTAQIAHLLDDSSPVPPETRDHALFLRIKAFIHHHLDKPDLTPGAIATAHHMSTRRLHHLFQRHGQTVAAFVRHRRLEHIRRDLADPALAHRPTYTIAARWALTNPAHFNRLFTAAYATPPGEYRHRALRGTPPLADS